MIILLHTSKTMRPPAEEAKSLQKPELLNKTEILAEYLKTLSVAELGKAMHVSPKLAVTTHELIAGWTAKPKHQRVSIDSFLGDIYSGLQVQSWSEADRQYANEHLRILSGLYGVLRPLDGIYPYRLEMGYKLPGKQFANLYDYWGDSIAQTIPDKETIVNLAAVEYSKTVTNYLPQERFIAPSFLTYNPKTKEPSFVVVHAKIARGAFAAWMIKYRIEQVEQLKDFDELGYQYDKVLSTLAVPVFVCKQFKGLGLSVRLT